MSLGVCVPDLIAQGKIPQSKAKAAQDMYDRLLRQYDHHMGSAAAEGMATQQVVKALEMQVLQKKRVALLQVKAQASMLENARAHYANGKFADGPINGKALMAHIVRDERAPYANVEYRSHNIKQTALGMMYDLLARHRRDVTGRIRNKSDLIDVVHELFGKDSGSLNARELAQSWRAASEYLRQRFNAAGGMIGKLESWGVPQSHDAYRVGAVTKDAWISDLIDGDMLDRGRMIDDETGLPFSTERLRDMLGDVYETIVSEGWSKLTPGQAGQKMMANRRSEHRFLHFRDADTWLAYNEKYGAAEPLDAMLGHIDGMSRDIAMMEIMGPNPTATARWMQDQITKDAATKGTIADRMSARAAVYGIDALMRELSGQGSRVVNQRLALIGSTLRNWQTGTKLGSATLSSFSDVGTAALTRSFNGLDAMGTLADYMRMLNPADPADREFARRAGIIGDEFTGRAVGVGRVHMDELFGGRLADGGGGVDRALQSANEMSRRLADANLKLSGLNAWTMAGREAIFREFSAAITSHADVEFGALPPQFQRFFTRYGMGAREWDVIRHGPRINHKGMEWINPSDVADSAVRDRLMEAILTESDFAVPTSGLKARALVNAKERGTWLGEVIRTGFQFKAFPITVMMLHGGRLLARSDLSKKASYAAAFLGATTLTGAVGYQLAEISKGKDPRAMGDWNFIYRSMLKGGGLGLFGDVIENGLSEYGQDVGDITKGPAWGTAQNLADLGKALVPRRADDGTWEQKGVGRATANLLKREVPGSSLWYLRAAYERLLVDTVAQWSDDDYADSYARMEARAEKEHGGYWWTPGAGLDGIRAPNMANAFTMPEEPPQ